MTSKKTKKLLLIIIPVIIIIIIISILLMLYLTTDFLKSDKTLFYKYLSQNMDIAKALVDNTSEKQYTNILRKNKYESTAELSGSYTEKINTSEENKNNDINKLKLIVNTQSEYQNNYNYKDMRLSYNNNDIIKTEYIHDGNNYGIRFPERFNQFLTIDNQDLKQVAENSGLTEDQVSLIPNEIQEFDYNNVFSFTDEELVALQEKYINIISENISNDKYSKQKNAMITIGDKSINTIAYSVTLTQEQANDIYIKILEKLKEDEIIINKLGQLEPVALIFNVIKNDENAQNNNYLEDIYVDKIEEVIENIRKNNIGTDEVKYTVYVANGKTVRTQILEETTQTIIDVNSKEDGIEINIQNQTATQTSENERKIKISKTNNNEESNFSIQIENTLGDEKSTTDIYRNKKMNEEFALSETGIEYNDGKDNLLKIKLNENVELNKDFDRKVQLNEVNSVIINNYGKENVTTWVNQIREFLNGKVNDNQTIINNIRKVEPIGNILGETTQEIIVEENTGITEVEKNRFNSKFEFYTGKEKTSEDVIQLIEEAKNSLKGAQVSYSNEGSSATTKKLQTLKLNIEEGTQNVELANNVKAMIETNRTYTVTIEKDNDIVKDVIITLNN